MLKKILRINYKAMGKKPLTLLLSLLLAMVLILPAFNALAAKEQEHPAQELLSQGAAALSQGNTQLALEKFNAALKLDPDLPEAYINRGIVLMRLEQYVEAVEDFDKAVKLAPQSAEAFYNRALAYSRSGLYDKAVEDYTRALKYAPQDWQIFYNRGNAYLDQGKSPEALKDYNQALQLNPQAAEVYHNRGLAYLSLKDPQRALEDFDKTLELNQNFARATFNKCKALEQLGRKPEAIAACRRFLQTGDPGADAEYLQQALERLKVLEGK